MLSPIYFSETLFLSRSANAEIDYICGADGVRKNYFCVNLSDSQPKGILRKIMLMDEQLLDVETNEPVMITGETFVIGSEKRKCHLFIDNLRVSRVHATIAVKGGDTYIMDMGSMNGTFLNNKKIDALVSTLLRVNDLISLGGKQYRFVEES